MSQPGERAPASDPDRILIMEHQCYGILITLDISQIRPQYGYREFDSVNNFGHASYPCMSTWTYVGKLAWLPKFLRLSNLFFSYVNPSLEVFRFPANIFLLSLLYRQERRDNQLTVCSVRHWGFHLPVLMSKFTIRFLLLFIDNPICILHWLCINYREGLRQKKIAQHL